MTDRKLKVLFHDSLKFFETLFKPETTKSSDLSLLLEAWILSNPKLLLANGFLVYEIEDKKGHLMFSVSDFIIGKTYLSEKGTKLIRTSPAEMLLDQKIKVFTCTMASMQDGTSGEDEILKGYFHESIVESAIQFFSTKKLAEGIPLDVQDEHKQNIGGRVLFSMKDLELGVHYHCECKATNWTGELYLTREKLASQALLLSSNSDHETSCARTILLKFQPSDQEYSSFPVITDLRNVVSGKVIVKAPVNAVPERVGHSRRVLTLAKKFTARLTYRRNHQLVMSPKKRQMLSPAKRSPSKYFNTRSPAKLSVQRKLLFSPGRKSDGFDDKENIPNNQQIVDVPFAPPAPPLPPPPPSGLLKRAKAKKFRALHWTPLPESKLKSTIWSKTDVVEEIIDETIGVQMNKDLNDLFSLSPQAAKPTATKREVVNLLDLQRSNNIAIVLSRFKVPTSEIKRAITEFDESILSFDALVAIKSIIPTADEKKLLSNHKLSQALFRKSEKWILEVMNVPHLELRVQFFTLKLQLPVLLNDLNESIHCVASACQDVRESDKFAKILKLILALGSVLNEGTHLASQGFKLDSLCKLMDTKAKNGRTTLLHYLVQLVHNRLPELLNFHVGMPHIEAASRVAMDVVLAELKNIETILESLQKELGPSSNDDSDPLYRSFAAFYDDAKSQVGATHRSIDELMTSFQSVATYFGEEKEKIELQTTQSFFLTLWTFAQSFEKLSSQASKGSFLR
eukprot:TRINITY_DN7206_c0_g1_i1.p1 TRINITY_DN7206_c0_g1~~TRINITY_DN7206_c0_g1_i1.p1  ORF type:complete len:739 (-),score=147.03 TRINITY_DN7206_c0_g1_i1:81-2297(-)